LRPNKNWDYVCFTDDPEVQSDGVWEIERPVTPITQKQSRFFKLLPHVFFEESEQTVYIDGTVLLKYDIHDLCNNKQTGIWMGRHPMRQCAYQELEVIKAKDLDFHSIIDAQAARYRAEGFPENFGLWRGCRIIRNKGVEELGETWWKEFESGCRRDQPPLAYSSWKTGIKIESVLGGVMNSFFKLHLHLPRKNLTQLVVPVTERKTVNYKNCWLRVGDFPGYEEAIAAHPQVHAIFSRRGGFVFQGWLFDYLPHMDKFEEHLKFYEGVYTQWP
jgi:hypothetical protein